MANNIIIIGIIPLAIIFTFYICHQPRNRVRWDNVPPNPEEPLPPSSSPLQIFDKAAICTDHNECSRIAKDTLKRGGSAVDATLAALFCNGLVGLQSMGLGGGMLMNIYDSSEQKSYSILSREISPHALIAENFSKFRDENELKQSSWSIAIPTELVGYGLAHQRFGKLPWHMIVEPSLEICTNGYRLYKHQYDALHINENMIKNDPLLRRMFVNEITDKFWITGTLIYPPQELCETYKLIAWQGYQTFYNGTLSKQILADLMTMGSAISRDDLSNARATLTRSIVLPLDEYDLHFTPFPGSGYIVAYIMNILKEYRNDFALRKRFIALDIHRMIEAMKFGFVKRWQMEQSPHKQFMNLMDDVENATNIAKLINDSCTFNDIKFYGATSQIYGRIEHGTSHTSVIANNDAVSVTSSINFYFGSGRMGKRTGVLFNNAMSDFSLRHIKNYFELPYVEGKNMITPGASPLSSMSPLIVTERSTGNIRLVVGAAGGTKIISALVPLLVRILWQVNDIKSAIDAFRFHHQMLPNIMEYEFGLIESDLVELQTKGHQCMRYKHRGSIICGIEQKNGTLYTNSDYRKLGGISGF